jgi:hypothetical protein
MKINSSSILSLSAIFAACLYAATAHADASNAKDHMPPPEAIKACADKADKDACTFTGKENEAITGTCHKGPGAHAELACVPAHDKPAEH